MNIDGYSYLWNEEKEDHVLVNSKFGYGIVNKKERMMLMVCDEELKQKLIKKMLENGNVVYEDINQAFMDV